MNVSKIPVPTSVPPPWITSVPFAGPYSGSCAKMLPAKRVAIKASLSFIDLEMRILFPLTHDNPTNDEVKTRRRKRGTIETRPARQVSHRRHSAQRVAGLRKSQNGHREPLIRRLLSRDNSFRRWSKNGAKKRGTKRPGSTVIFAHEQRRIVI